MKSFFAKVRLAQGVLDTVDAETKNREVAASALRQSEEQTRMIIDTALDAVIGMDATGMITAWNRQAEVIFGWTQAEAVGRDLSETIIPPNSRERHKQGLQHFLATGEGPVLNRRIEVTALHRDRSEFPVELAICPLKVGDSYSFNAFIEDITQRKQTEEALRNAKEAAENANKAKSEFLANMSHEIRTPMNGVLGMSELLLGTDLTDKQRQFAETVHRSGRSLLAVINDILDFSKIEAGKLELECLDFDVRQAVEDVMDLLAESALNKRLELACLISEEIPPVLRGDPGRVRQILTNLVGNAIKFTPQGEVVVHVTPVETTAEAVVLRFAVSDTGIGIDPKSRERIFAPFAQADGSTTRKYGGTGLGLAIAKQLAELMGGAIGVQSETGHGSTFWFTARLTRSSDDACAGKAFPQSLQGLRVLLVDDNATNREILQHQVKAWGMRDGCAADGPQGLAMLRRAADQGDPYDLAILDMHMPGMDGLELAGHIHTDASIANVRLVMLTSVNGDGDGEAARAAGICAFLSKPVRQAHLFKSLVGAMGAPCVTPTDCGGKRRRDRTRAVAPLHGVVLLAEDNPVNTEVARGMLEACGLRVDVATNGREAVEAVGRTAYDLVFMDCQMPEMGGFDATRLIRAQQAAREDTRTPIIALTAHAMDGDHKACLDAGMDDYLSKPFTQDQLRSILGHWMGGTSHRPEDSRVAAGSVSAPPQSGTVDPRALERIRALQREGKPDVQRKAIEIYLRIAPTFLETLRAAVTAADADAIYKAAHALRSSSANLGAVTLSELCMEVETMGRANALESVAAVLEKMEAEYPAVRRALTAELRKENG